MVSFASKATRANFPRWCVGSDRRPKSSTRTVTPRDRMVKGRMFYSRRSEERRQERSSREMLTLGGQKKKRMISDDF